MCGVLGHCRRHPSTWLPAGTPGDRFWGRKKTPRAPLGAFGRAFWLGVRQKRAKFTKFDFDGPMVLHGPQGRVP